MNQTIAKCLFQNCGFLFIAGVPNETQFGIDLTSYSVGEMFRGVKLIPTGPHYVFCACKDDQGDVAPRVGFVHYFQANDIVVREWNPEQEELRRRKPEQEEIDIQRIKDNIKDLDRFLAPYDFEEYTKWRDLTDHISEDLVNQLMPSCGLVRTAVEYLSCNDADRPRGHPAVARLKIVRSVADEDDLLPDLKPIPGTAPNFSALPRIPKASTPAEISSFYMDSVLLLRQLLQSPERVLGEVQFAYILMLCGHSTDALAHWRRILGLVSNSEEAVKEFKEFYVKYLEVIKWQLPELPAELMEPTKNNSVYQDVRKLVGNCLCEGLAVDQFKRYLYEKLNWRFDDLLREDPEDLPVVVELED